VKIKIEIDLKPEELQRFLGLPNVGAMREELMQFLKEKVAADPAGFLRGNIDQLRKSRTVQRLLYGTGQDLPDPPQQPADEDSER
jgi:hypothetical protein